MVTRLDDVDLLKAVELFELTDIERELAMLRDGTVLLVFKLLLLLLLADVRVSFEEVLPLLMTGRAAGVVLISLSPRTMCRKFDGLFVVRYKKT